jgi:DNA-binding CsgD family transcriptional regulator/tetratricopeptide (TPR) repeat protein
MPKHEIIGREPELELVERFLRQLENGPSALLLEGEAGTGKTTLWREALARAEKRGCLVLRTQPAEAEAALTFAGLADLFGPVLDRILPALPTPQREALEVALLRAEPSKEVDRLALSLAALGGLREVARDHPVVVAVDDLQWLDAPSAGVLGFILRRLELEPLALVASARLERRTTLPVDLDRSLPPGRLTRLRVEPLELEELGLLLRARLDLTVPASLLRRLHELSGGNPFYALEVGRALPPEASLAAGEPVVLPHDLSELLGRRLDRLSKRARELVLAVSALSGPSVSLVERLDASGLEEGLAAGALELEGERVLFAHPLLGSTAYARATPSRRRRLHRGLAEVVENPEERVLHLALGTKEPDRAVSAALEETAAAASSRGAPDAAADLADRAFALTPAADAEDRVRRRLLTADYLFAGGDGEGARAVLEELITALPAGHERAEALQRLAWITPDAARAIALGEQALDESGDDLVLQAEIHVKLTRMVAIRGEREAVQRHMEAALALAEMSGDADVLVRALGEHIRRHAGWSGHGFDREAANRALELSLRARRVTAYESAERTVGTVLALLDQVQEARPLLEEAFRRAIDAGEMESEIGILIHMAELETRAEQWRIAEGHIRRALELERLSGLPDLAYVLGVRAHVAALLGQAEEARPAGEEGSSRARETGQELFFVMNEHALGFLDLSLGNADAAGHRLEPLPSRLRQMGIRDPTIFPVLPDTIEAVVGAGRLDRAQELVEALEREGRRLDRPRALAGAARGRALLAETSGRPAEALEWVERSLAETDRLGSSFERARSLLVGGRIHRRERQKGKAKAVLEEARELFEQLEALLWVERTGGELRRIGLRPPAPAGLTPTERKVAELVAAGRTNREVAAELFLSVKTVESCLTRIYRKEGVRSRTELARVLLERSRS